MNKICVVSCMCLCLAMTAGLYADDQAVRVDIKADGKRAAVSPELYGIFYEEINHAGDGGLYAEMVQNRSFEEHLPPANAGVKNGRLVTKNGWSYQPFLDSGLHAWSKVEQGGAKLTMELDKTVPLNDKTPHAMKVKVEAVGQGAGVANEGYWGMAVAAGQTYNLSFYARTDAGQTVDLTAALESAEGKNVYAKSTIVGVGGQWKQYQCALKAEGTDTKSRLVIRFNKPAAVWLDMVSLFPQDTYKQRPGGLRKDLVAMLEGMRPGFLRFPGGCVVEGCTLDDRIQWKKTIGDIAQRPGHWDLWGYRASDGLGYHEFLQLAEDLNAAPMYVVNVGMSCQARNFEFVEDNNTLVDEYVRDTLDALDYAMAPVTNTWGALRAKNGHAEPFKIKYVEIGNENGGEIYHKHYKIFYDAIKKKYPQIITIADQPIPNAPVEIIDEHYYVNPNVFFSTAEKYDTYDRKGPKIYVGEYAVNQNVGAGNLLGALSESAWMMGMERNSDVVVMASYAPLFENVNDREWPTNLIRFDGSRVIGRSSYHVQKMFAENLPTVMLDAAITYPTIQAPDPQGKIGLRTWLSDAEYKDIRVTRDGAVLYASDFSKQAEGWQVKAGQWVVENGVYRQKDPVGQDTLTVFGDDTWAEYTLELKAKRNTGKEGFMALVRYSDDNAVQWNLGGWGNTKHAIQVGGAIVAEAPGSIEAGRWYDVKIVLNGEQVKCYLDGKLIHDTSIRVSTPRMWCANVGLDEKSGELIVKMCNATEKPMPFDIRISGYSQIASKAQVVTLSGTGPDDENTLDEPRRVAPVTSMLEGVTKEFVYPVKPWSVTILRIPAKR
jgi:alpha-L-arabinofuranosidase